MVERDGILQTPSVKQIEDERRLFLGLFHRSRLRVKVHAALDAGRTRLFKIRQIAFVGIQPTLGVAPVAHTNNGKVNAIGSHGVPIDVALMVGHVHAGLVDNDGTVVVDVPSIDEREDACVEIRYATARGMRNALVTPPSATNKQATEQAERHAQQERTCPPAKNATYVRTTSHANSIPNGNRKNACATVVHCNPTDSPRPCVGVAMIEVSGIRIPLSKLDGSERSEQRACRKALQRMLRVRPGDILQLDVRKRSIDARKKDAIVLIFTVWAKIRGDEASIARGAGNRVRVANEQSHSLPAPLRAPHGTRPVVVGAGCAGLFCALALASAGLNPLLVERGDDAERRTRIVEHFNGTGELDPECNIQFGLGGAGTFSDGKLGTGTKSVAHRLILQTLVDAGAQRRILWDAKPHVGSDVLPNVVSNMVSRIQELGGEVRFRTQLTNIDLHDGSVQGVVLLRDGRSERLRTTDVVLACGHSARDVFKLVQDLGVALERKTFAMGVRIEHLQADVDRALYGASAGHPALGAAPYKLAEHLPNDRSAFSFCMCPGGYVVAAASEQEGVVTNGMSLSSRAGTNANSGLLVNVFPTDLPGDDVLAGIELQRACERAAFSAGSGHFAAPAQLVGDFLQHAPSSGQGRVEPTYPRGVSWGDVSASLPDYVSDTLRAAIPRMGRKLRGFDAPDAVLTGVETRSSSPVRIVRTNEGQSTTTAGLWPCGEGAGYAGGIMSAATDGLRIAEALVASRQRVAAS